MNNKTYSCSDTLFTINNIVLLVKISNFALVFFKTVYHANLGAKRKRVGSSSYFRSFQKHELTIIYHLEHINHDIPLNVPFQNL